MITGRTVLLGCPFWTGSLVFFGLFTERLTVSESELSFSDDEALRFEFELEVRLGGIQTIVGKCGSLWARMDVFIRYLQWDFGTFDWKPSLANEFRVLLLKTVVITQAKENRQSICYICGIRLRDRYVSWSLVTRLGSIFQQTGMTIKTPLALYVWPGRWNLPSIDAGCIEAILLLQLTCPARYSVVETTDLDASPNGHLPYLVHGQVVVASVPSITSYLKSVNAQLLALEEDDSLPSLNTAIDNSLSSRDRSKIPAWRAYIEGQLGTLMVCYPFINTPRALTSITGSFIVCPGTKLYIHT